MPATAPARAGEPDRAMLWLAFTVTLPEAIAEGLSRLRAAFERGAG
jgi:hypothetical protein